MTVEPRGCECIHDRVDVLQCCTFNGVARVGNVLDNGVERATLRSLGRPIVIIDLTVACSTRLSSKLCA
jgi:hypothetical protein